MAGQTNVTSAAEYGGFWIRFLALLVDSAILFLVGGIVVVGAGMALGVGAVAPVYMAVSLACFLYWPIMQASARQATFGKAMLGLKVTGYSGERISILRSFGRELGKFISGAVFMVGYLIAAFTSRKQALHDLVASTYVVRESPPRTIAALATIVAGFVIPPVAGTVLLGGAMMSMMTALMEPAQKSAPGAGAPRPVPKSAAKVVPPQPRAPAMQASTAQAAPTPPTQGGDVEALLAPTLTGLEKPGTTRAGPAILELGTMFPTSFWLKTYMPAIKEYEGSSGAVTVLITRVVDKSGADLYDPANRLETRFFQQVSISHQASPVPHLAGTRQVSLRSGAGTGALERVEGTLKLAVPFKPMTATFAAADAGKEQTLHGATIGLRSLSGKDVELRYRGEGNRLVGLQGFGSDGKPLKIEIRQNWPELADATDAQFKVTFSAPVSRLEASIAERIVERQFPFTVTQSSLAETPSALAQAQARRPAEKAAPAPAPAATVAAVPAPTPTSVPARLELAAVPAPAPKTAMEKSAGPAAARKTAAPMLAIAWTPPPTPLGRVLNPSFNDLMTAVLYRSATGVDELIALGKWPDKPDSQGITPLMAAAMIGDSPSAEALLKAGADPNLTAKNGRTAAAFARERGDRSMQALLERHGAR